MWDEKFMPRERSEGVNPTPSAYSTSGEMAERLKAPVSKTGVLKRYRGFKSHSLRTIKKSPRAME